MIQPEINLNGWVTVTTLAAEMQCSTQVISKQMKRFEQTGKGIPFYVCKELNNIRLVPGLELQRTIKAEQ